ncbi:MAG: type IV pilus assembly protein PilM [Candidatus Moraniibacteriota bacterium]
MFDQIFGKNTFIGVDIGTSSIKVVELRVSEGKPMLSNYAWMTLGEEMLGKGDNNSEYFYAVLPRLLKKVFKKAKFSGRDVFVALPSFSGLITLIDFPEMASADMEQAIRFEAQKHIPTSLDEVVINWEIVGKRQSTKNFSKNEGEGVAKKSESVLQVLLIAASKDKVLKYENLVKAAGLNLKSISLETFPIVRSLIGNDPGNFVLVDIGARVCNVILVEKGIIKINRSINAGGADMTKTIAKSMNIDNERAATLKRSAEKNFFEPNSTINFFTLELIIGEVDRIIKAYAKDGEGQKIDGIVLSGGTSGMTGITDYFFSKLKVKTIVGDPLSRIKCDAMLEPVISNLRSDFSICIGLALSGVDSYLKAKNKVK